MRFPYASRRYRKSCAFIEPIIAPAIVLAKADMPLVTRHKPLIYTAALVRQRKRSARIGTVKVAAMPIDVAMVRTRTASRARMASSKDWLVVSGWWLAGFTRCLPHATRPSAPPFPIQEMRSSLRLLPKAPHLSIQVSIICIFCRAHLLSGLILLEQIILPGAGFWGLG
jgi:hypothetical protein